MRLLINKNRKSAVVGVIIVFQCLVFSCTPVFAGSIPAGCPGGPDGPPAPGTVCPGGKDANGNPASANCPSGSTCQYQPQQDPATQAQTCQSDNNCKQIYTYLYDTADLVSALVGIVAVAMIIYGGIEFSSSGGDPQRVASAKKHITNAIIALVAFLFLWAFLNFIIPGGVFNSG